MISDDVAAVSRRKDATMKDPVFYTPRLAPPVMQQLGPRKHRRCELYGGGRYFECWTNGHIPHGWAYCFANLNATLFDLVNYRTGHAIRGFALGIAGMPTFTGFTEGAREHGHYPDTPQGHVDADMDAMQANLARVMFEGTRRGLIEQSSAFRALKGLEGVTINDVTINTRAVRMPIGLYPDED